MSNAGFSAPTNYWGVIAGLTPKSSQNGNSMSVATAPNEYGDVVAVDYYGETLSPSVEYAVTGNVNLAGIALGTVYSVGSKKVMLTNVSINTSAGSPPTVTISGVGVEDSAVTGRTFACFGTLTPRSKAQDVCAAFTANSQITSVNTTFSVTANTATVAGEIVASDVSNGIVEVNATLTDYAGNLTLSKNNAAGFEVSTNSENAPDANYITRTATATKYLTPTAASNS